MNALFLKIINMSIASSWLILAVLIQRLVLKRAPKWIKVLLWSIVAVRLICPFSFESALSLIPSAETVPLDIEKEGAPVIDSGINAINNIINPVISSFTPNSAASANPLQIWILLASFLWILGMIVFLLYTAISYWRLHRKIDNAVLYKSNIFQSENVISPFVLGIIKPRIYLPFKIDDQDLEHVAAHEQAHIRRKDHWWKPFGFLLLTIHWFNPLVWLAYILLCRDIELACDEKVIKELGSEQRADYTQALVACSVNRRMITACPLAFGEVGVKERVKSVMNYKKPAFWIIVLAFFSCIIVAVCFLTNPKQNSYSLRIVVPAGSQDQFVYADEEISPLSNHIIITSGDGLKDTEVLLKTVQVKTETSYEPTYLTPGMPVKMKAEKDAWFKIGVNIQNPSTEDKIVYVNVDNVDVRIASAGESENSNHNDYVPLESNEEAEALTVTPAVELNDVQMVLDRVISSIGLENAFPWNNTVDLKENADALIKMTNDATGRFEIYGIMSAEYGTFGLLLNDWIGGEENWNFAYVPWYYSGAPSEQPILEPDGEGKYIFAYIYKYDDVPHWHEYVLDCGYDTGHMELKNAPNEDGQDDASLDPSADTTVIHYPAQKTLYEPTPAEQVEEKYDNEEFVITKLHYETLGGEWVCDSCTYKYRLEITGKMKNSAKNTTYIVLSNTKDITFDQTWKASGFSSNMSDYFDPSVAVIVGNKVFS